MSSFNIETVKGKISEFVAQYPSIDGPLTKISEKTKIDKSYVALGLAFIPILIVFILGAGHVIIDLVGFIYPVYASIKAIESPEPEDDSLWLTYWIIFCLFKVVEGVADFLISFIPFYFLGKLAFLIWCYYPSTKGAKVVYEQVVKPFVVPLLGLEKKTEKSE